MTDKESMAMALDAFEDTHYRIISAGLLDQDLLNRNFTVATALRERLAQPEQEPRDCILTEIEYAHHHGWPLESQQRLVRMVEAQRKIPPAQPAQRTEPVAWLCTPNEDGLFGLPLSDKGCKDCFPVYRHPPRRIEQNFCSRCGKRTPDLTHIHTCTPPREGT